MMGSIMELLADSFQAEALVAEECVILLPERVVAVMGSALKVDVCRHSMFRYLLLSKRWDALFAGTAAALYGTRLILPRALSMRMPLFVGEQLVCTYSGVGQYAVIRRKFT